MPIFIGKLSYFARSEGKISIRKITKMRHSGVPGAESNQPRKIVDIRWKEIACREYEGMEETSENVEFLSSSFIAFKRIKQKNSHKNSISDFTWNKFS